METNEPKLILESLYIETTRRCNMSCEHCMRGDAQASDLDPDILRPLLEQTDYIETIGFSGGEPSLNPNAIASVLELCKEYHINVGNFYIVTNGKELSDQFLHTMMNWLLYTCGDPDMNGIALSQDEYHEPIPWENRNKLQLFSAFRPDDKKVDFHHSRYARVLNLGRATELMDVEKQTEIQRSESPRVILDSEENLLQVHDKDFYVTVNGNILETGNYEYSEEDNITISHISDMETFRDYLNQYAEEY